MSQHKHTPATLDGILEFLAERPCASTAEVSAAVNISVYQARYHLLQLSDNGLVEEIRAGRGVSTRWQPCGDNME